MLLKILRPCILKSRYIFKSYNSYLYSMEANKDIKVVDYKVDQYGDYPFINSTFRSGRKWTPLFEVN